VRHFNRSPTNLNSHEDGFALIESPNGSDIIERSSRWHRVWHVIEIEIDRMRDGFIDRWLGWQDQRKARRAEQWKRRMYRGDQRFDIW
jgi:hypothetical protein